VLISNHRNRQRKALVSTIGDVLLLGSNKAKPESGCGRMV